MFDQATTIDFLQVFRVQRKDVLLVLQDMSTAICKLGSCIEIIYNAWSKDGPLHVTFSLVTTIPKGPRVYMKPA